MISRLLHHTSVGLLDNVVKTEVHLMPLEQGLPPERNRKDRAKFHLADDCGIKS